MNNFREVTNTYPTTLTKRLFHASERPFIASLRHTAYSTCRTQISDLYIKSAFNKFKYGYVYTRGDEVVSFCIWKIKEEISIAHGVRRELYVYLVCSIKEPYSALDMMLNDLEQYCIENRIEVISLEPANERLREHYTSRGFAEDQFRKSLLVKAVAPITYYRSRTTRRSMRPSKQHQ